MRKSGTLDRRTPPDEVGGVRPVAAVHSPKAMLVSTVCALNGRSFQESWRSSPTGDSIQVVTSLPSTYTANNTCAEVWVAPSGRFLYGSNRGHDSIAIFAIDPSDGTLSAVGWQPTEGRTPRYFGLDPTATSLYAANQNSDTVVEFAIDERTGKLKLTGQVVKAASPSTIVFR